MTTLLYLPLDDRPCNRLLPLQMAEAAGHRVLVPPSALLGTFLTPGAPELIIPWLLSQGNQARHFVVSLEMLTHGGLIGSRNPDCPLSLARQRLDSLRRLNKIHPDSHLWVSSIIMRLSITVRDQATAQWWEKIFRYFRLSGEQEVAPRPETASAMAQLEGEIPSELLASYRVCRARNHALNLAAIELAADGVVDHLVLGQEDAAIFGPHRREQDILQAEIKRRRLEERVTLLTGADELGALLMGRVLKEEGMPLPHFAFIFHYPPYRQAILPYEDQPLDENLARHLKVLGPPTSSTTVPCYVHHPPEERPEVARYDLSLTPPRDDTRRNGNAEEYGVPADDGFISELKERLSRAEAERICLLDVAYANGADPDLLSSLDPLCHYVNLLAFSAWNTAGNSMGTLFPEAMLAAAAPSRDHLLLWHHYLDDYLYQSKVREELRQSLEQGVNPWDLGSLHQHYSLMAHRLLAEAARQRGLPVKFSAHLPWPRLFEIEIGIGNTIRG